MHTSCNLCGSSDARFVYPDGGSFCFSCWSPGGKRISPYVRQNEGTGSTNLSLPDDCSFDYPEHVLSWTSKYHITVEELISHDVYYSKQRDQLIFTWEAASGEVCLWQARNFSKTAKAKCYTKGKPDAFVPIYTHRTLGHTYGSPQRLLVIVEDPISAIKCSRFTCAMPVLGSDLSKDKIKHIARHLEGFLGCSEVVVWLDGNMFHKAQRIAQRFKMLGVEARAVYTQLDPKEYTNDEIRKIIE